MICALMIISQQSAQQRVDFREPAAIGSNMVKKIGAAFGQNVYAGEGIDDVPIIFDVKSVTFDEFRSLSAEGLDATWREVKDGWEIYRTVEQISAEEKAYLARRSAAIKEQITAKKRTPSIAQEKLVELASQIKIADDDELEELTYDTVIDGDSFFYDIWAGLGTEYFVRLPIDQRLYFTSDGRNGTKRLTFLKESQSLIEAERRKVIDTFKLTGSWFRLEETAAMSSEVFLRKLGVGNALWLSLEIVSTRDKVRLLLSGFDDQGNETFSSFDWIDLDIPFVSHPFESVPDQPITLSQDTIKFKESLGKWIYGDMLATKVFREFLGRIDEHDILSYEISDVLFWLSEVLDKPLIGRLSDELVDEFGFVDRAFISAKSDAQFETTKSKSRTLLTRLDETIQFDLPLNGTICVTPDLPRLYQPVFARQPIAEYIRANDGETLIDLNRFAGIMIPPPTLDAELYNDIALYAHSNGDSFSEPNIPVISAFAGLTTWQREQSATSEGITLLHSKMAPMTKREFVETAINQGDWSLIGSPEAESDQEEGEWMDNINNRMQFDIGPSTLDGLLVNVRTKRAMNLIAYHPLLEGGEITTTEEVAESLFSVESRLKHGKKAEYKYTFGIEEVMTIELRYNTPVGIMIASTVIQVTDGGPKDLTLENLPSSIKQEILKHLEELRRDESMTGTLLK